MANTNAPMPTYFTPFLKEDGRINEPWYRFLFQLQQRTGGASGSDFVTQAQLDATNKQVAAQDNEINGLYPDAPLPVPDIMSDGVVQIPVPFPDSESQMFVPFPVGTLSQQNSDSVAITGGAIDGTPIGAITPATGKFTSVTATGTIIPASTNGIFGTLTNDNANTGSVGEYITANASAVSVSSGVAANVTSISLDHGDWDVTGQVVAVPAGSTVLSQFGVGINTTSATMPSVISGLGISILTGSLGTATNPAICPMTTRISISGSTTVYLVTSVNFTVSTCTVNGFIRARRVR